MRMHGIKFNTNCMTQSQWNNNAGIQVTGYAAQKIEIKGEMEALRVYHPYTLP